MNVASRLQAAADPGSVCITRATLDVVEGFVDATPLGERQFKGKAQPTETYRLDAVRSGLTRFGAKRRHGLTQLRGRDVELALLHEHWNVVKAGRFRPVNVIGDAGFGKSRLIFEFTETLREQPVLLLEAICRPEGAAIPFMPLIEVMRRWFGLTKLSRGFELRTVGKPSTGLRRGSRKCKLVVLNRAVRWHGLSSWVPQGDSASAFTRHNALFPH